MRKYRAALFLVLALALSSLAGCTGDAAQASVVSPVSGFGSSYASRLTLAEAPTTTDKMSSGATDVAAWTPRVAPSPRTATVIPAPASASTRTARAGAAAAPAPGSTGSVSAPAASELDQARSILAGLISQYPVLAGTTVEFGDAKGYQAISYYKSGRIVISSSHTASLSRILNHEAWHVIDWRDNGSIDWGESVPPR